MYFNISTKGNVIRVIIVSHLGWREPGAHWRLFFSLFNVFSRFLKLSPGSVFSPCWPFIILRVSQKEQR